MLFESDKMKTAAILLMITACFAGCVTRHRSSINPPMPEHVTTIKYSLEPFRTFEIVGTGVKGMRIDDLPEAISQHQQDYPGAVYEIYAEVKSGVETSDKIIEIVKGAGVTLKHYWAPVSFVDLSKAPGKYGYGHVDLIEK